MGTFSNYDVFGGLSYVAAGFGIFVILILAVLSFRLYRCLLAQDAAIAENKLSDIRSDVVDIIKRAILWILGYRGENREKVSVADVDLGWVSKYQTSILFRFLPIYAFYILSLVVLTRPIFFADEKYQIFKYSENLYELFTLLGVYVISNIVFDYISLRYSLSHAIQAQETRRYVYFFLKDMVAATVLFLMSQSVSCVLWVLKRDNSDFPDLGESLFDKFIEITLWPYAFVSGQGAAEIISPLFPGQLRITGTVYFPTLILGTLFVVFALFLLVARTIKRFLISRQLDRICRLFLKIHLVGMFNPSNVGNQFRYCNYAFMALLNISFITSISVLASRAFGPS